MRELEEMILRQKVLADFGELSLRSGDLDEVLTEACRLVGHALGTDMAKVLEIEKDKAELLVRAGVGWHTGIVGEKRLPMGERSSETYAINAGVPIISHIDDEVRFEFADFLRGHGVVSLVNVPIFLPGGTPYGLLQVDSRVHRDFGQEDIEFLRTYAIILGPVIDRLHKSYSLRQALETNNRLFLELQHRVKNNLAIIASLVRMRARNARSDETRCELASLDERINTLRLLTDHLGSPGSDGKPLLRPLVAELAESLCTLYEDHSGKVTRDLRIPDLGLAPGVTSSIALILNEFVTNSLKYAFDGRGGTITVEVEPMEAGALRLQIRDDGKGLPANSGNPERGSGSGMRLIEGLARQIGATPVWAAGPGTSLCLEFDGGL